MKPGTGGARDRESLAEYARELVDRAPPLTPEQRARLAVLLDAEARPHEPAA